MFNIAFQANSVAEAKTELNQRNDEQETPMSDVMVDAVERVIGSVGGKGPVNVGLYGDGDGLLNLSVRRVAA